MAVRERAVEMPLLGRIEVFEDPPYDWYLSIGAALVNMFRKKKELEQDDIDNPVPAMHEFVIEDVRHPNGDLIGQCRMTYWEKLTIWDYMDFQSKKLQVKPPVNANHLTKIQLEDGTVITTNVIGKSYAAKQVAKNIHQRLSNEKYLAEDRARREKNKRRFL